MQDEKNFPKGIFWLGLLLMIAMLFAIRSALYGDPDRLYAPRWVVAMAFLVFFNSGVMIYMMDGHFNAFRQNIFFSGFHVLTVMSIPLFLVIILNWVSFGPGEREFSASISIPFLSVSMERVNQILGRLFFGIPTFFIDLVLVGAVGKAIYDAVYKWVNEEDAPEDAPEE